MKYSKILLVVFLLISLAGYSQNPTPQFKAPQAPQVNTNFSEQSQKQIREQNQVFLNQMNRSAQDRRKDWEALRKELIEEENEMRIARQKKLYEEAFQEIQAMLEGKQMYSLKRAVFLVENAFLIEKLDAQRFDHTLDSLAKRCKELAEIQDWDWNDSEIRTLSLVRLLADTVQITNRRGKVLFQNQPLKYDFDDINGFEDWTKLFVSKLMFTGKGQCHSLPLLYKMLSEELDVPAYLSFAPNHSFIKFQDKRGELHNFECTNGHFTSDAWLMASGYVKAPALKSGIFLDTLGQNSTLVYCLQDLALGYLVRYGYEDFVFKCADLGIKYNPKAFQAWILKANYVSLKTRDKIKALGNPPKSEADKHPELKKLLDEMYALYAQLDAIGYEEMPADLYEQWRQSVRP